MGEEGTARRVQGREALAFGGGGRVRVDAVLKSIFVFGSAKSETKVDVRAL